MTGSKIPHLVYADSQGNIYEESGLLMLVRRGRELSLPRPQEMIPLPESSDLFLLPGRQAAGLNPETGEVEQVEGLALAGFAPPGHTLHATTAFIREENAPYLPLFAYGAVGLYQDRLWIAAKLLDPDQRHDFSHTPQSQINQKTGELLQKYPKNRLIHHLAGCARNYCCPTARGLALGRIEGPVPIAPECNAACIGCISYQPQDSGFSSTQSRLDFAPGPREISEVMLEHCRGKKRAILSFGQGCEGEPLTRGDTILKSLKRVRPSIPQATININTNASRPDYIPELARAGLDSLRVSLNSAHQDLYHAYYRPRDYTLDHVLQSITLAREHNIFVSLNLLFFPGITDTETELDGIVTLIRDCGINFIQMRNLNLDPDIYLNLVGDRDLGPQMGLENFQRRIKKECPWIEFGYFNPCLTRQ